jgi:membrane fusion protein (multidrug efflux system)
MRFLLIVALLLVAGCGNGSSGAPSPPAVRPHLVELVRATVGQLAYSADRGGSLRALREVRLVNQEEGEIVHLEVREGDRIAAGEVLVRYDGRLLGAELDKAEATLRQTELDHERARQLNARGFVGQEALSRAATAVEIARAEARLLRERVRNLALAAPFAGVVSERLVEPGSVTPRHTHLLTLIDLSTLVTDVAVSELVLPRLKIGDAAGVRIDALGDAVHAGRILRIHPSVDPATRTGRVEVALDPVPAGARPGQFCRVELATGSREQIVVPLAALRRDVQGEFVYVYQDDGSVRRADVTSGLRLADSVEIRDGLAAGAQVVVKGFIGLAPGQRVRPVETPGV